MGAFFPAPTWASPVPPIPLGTVGQVLTMQANGLPGFAAGGVGAELAYAPSAGNVDPGSGVAGFSASTGIVLLTLAGATVFAGWPAGTGTQRLRLVILPASTAGSTLTIPNGAATAGKAFLTSAPNPGMLFSIGDTLGITYSPTEALWLLEV